ncbi:MAG: alpha/beta fold hydrolase [Polaromonas sp.]|nr:alpha/beta fold hydrolase [Polaromonas sp.]
MKIIANSVDIEVDISGRRADGEGRTLPVVLLIMGLGMQLTAWPPALVQALVEAGFCVVRFDNRDAGLSQQLSFLGTPNLVVESLKYKLGWRLKPPYTVQDMAQDALGVLDALGIAAAHVVGVSMGGMIAQRVALSAPGRTLSLTSIMSSSGARSLPGPAPYVTRALLSRPAGRSEEAAIAHAVKLFTLIASPGFPRDAAALQQQVAQATRRGYHPAGTARQMVAVVADTARTAELHRITAPTLVIHGRADPLVPFACGEDTAARIPGAELVGIDGMGHDMPPGVVTHILSALLPHLQRVAAA